MKLLGAFAVPIYGSAAEELKVGVVMRVQDWTADEEAPRQESMRANLKPAERKAPTGDQKKERRQLNKKTASGHSYERGDFAGHVLCENCGEHHPAEYSHEGRFGEGPIFASVCPQDNLVDYYNTHGLDSLYKGASIDQAGDKTCESCGYHGAPVLGDATGPNCAQCGSYSLVKKATITMHCLDCGSGQDHSRFGDKQCLVCGGHNLLNMTDHEFAKSATLTHQCNACGSRQDKRLGGDSCMLCGSNDLTPIQQKSAMLECADCGETSREDPTIKPRLRHNGRHLCDYCDHVGYSIEPHEAKIATQFEQQIAAPDGRVLINAGDHFRGPGGQTVKVHQVRQRPGFIGQYYLDTDLGTTLVNHDHRLTLVPHDTRQQALPSYADARGNSNTLPGGAGQSGAGGDALHGDVCSVCGSHNAMVSKGNQAVCTQCGHRTTVGGGMSYGDAPHIYGNPKVSSLSTAVARRAAEVYESMNKENPL